LIAGTIGIPLDGSYAPQVGGFVKPEEEIVVIAPEGREKESVSRLLRIGYDNVLGYVEGGFEAAKEGQELQAHNSITIEGFKDLLLESKVKPYVLDVRNKGEWESTGVVEGATLISMSQIRANVEQIPKDKPVYVHCKAGGRSYLSYTLLKKFGVDAIDVLGGTNSMEQAGIKFVKV